MSPRAVSAAPAVAAVVEMVAALVETMRMVI